jgi:hypothetical protein
MPPATRSAEREEERRLNTRTLTIASAASASAAAVTSQLWIAGTWIAAALTPVLVALISEAMHRPTERIARAWTSEREMSVTPSATPTRREPTSVSGTAGPVRVYRQSGPRTTMLTRRRIAIGTVAATAAIACVIGLVALTTVDLVSGGSVGKGSSRFTLGGNGGNGDSAQQQDQTKDAKPDQQQRPEEQQQQQQQQTAPSDQPTTTEPAPDEQPPSDTAPVPPPSDTPPGEPVPNAPSTP